MNMNSLLSAAPFAESLIGRTVLVDVGVATNGRALKVPCYILSARRVYGRNDLQVTPIGGSGETWISADRANLVPKPEPAV